MEKKITKTTVKKITNKRILSEQMYKEVQESKFTNIFKDILLERQKYRLLSLEAKIKFKAKNKFISKLALEKCRTNNLIIKKLKELAKDQMKNFNISSKRKAYVTRNQLKGKK